MSFNYNLLQQVKQAMHKAAAPVPPEEVTGEKPYVRPQYLEPQQPKTKEQSREEFLRSMADESARATAEPMSEEEVHKNLKEPFVNLIKDIQYYRAYKNIPSNADLSAYPKVQEEYKKLYVPKIKELIAALPQEALNQVKTELGGDQGINYFLENAHAEPGYIPNFPLPKRLNISTRNMLSGNHSAAIDAYTLSYLKNFRDRALEPLKNTYDKATPQDFGKLRATVFNPVLNPYGIVRAAGEQLFGNRYPYAIDGIPSDALRSGHLFPIHDSLFSKINLKNTMPNFNPNYGALQNRIGGFETKEFKEKFKEALKKQLQESVYDPLDTHTGPMKNFNPNYGALQSLSGGFDREYNPNNRYAVLRNKAKPATKPNIPYSPASHMDAGPPMLDKRFSRVDINAAKPQTLQPTKPQSAELNLPTIPSESPLTRRVSGGRGY